jgi:hypothetical protein
MTFANHAGDIVGNRTPFGTNTESNPYHPPMHGDTCDSLGQSVPLHRVDQLEHSQHLMGLYVI